MSNGGIIGPVQNPIVSVASSPGTSTFTASGPYTSPGTVRFVEVFLLGGGGGGQSSTYAGGGGSGGGIYQNSNLLINASTNYPIVIGGGGASSSSLTPNPVGAFGAAGGLGIATTGLGQTAPGGNSINGTPGAPHPGGNTGGAVYGGGGGAGGVGVASVGCQGGAGGPGVNSTLSGAPVNYGAGGSSGSNTGTVTAGVDGGAAGASTSTPAGAATVNRGGGGGGMRSGFSCGTYRCSSAGSSGIAFVKELTKSVAPGVWSLSEAYNYKKAGQWPS
jgi:hypothetical protein